MIFDCLVPPLVQNDFIDHGCWEDRRKANSSFFPFKDYERSALDFASHHQETEAEHLLAFDQILDQRPSQRQISMVSNHSF